MATEREKEFTDFGFKAPDYKRSQFSVRQSLEQRLQTIGVDPSTIGTTASRQVEDPEEAKRAESTKKVKTDEKPAAATSATDEEDEEKEYSLPADFLAEPAPAVNVGYKLTLVDETGKIKPLFPRENVNKPSTAAEVEKIDEKDLPTDERQRALVLEALKIKQEKKLKDEFERNLPKGV
jgi:hypothetical protein